MADVPSHGARQTVTRILHAVAADAPQASADLLPLVYADLRRLAASRLARLSPGQTLQATALVHEAYLRLVGDQDPGWQGRAHFFAACAEAMRLANPLYIARNHLVEAALSAAVQDDDLAPFERLLAVLQRPFEVREGLQDYALPAPAEAMVGYRTFCGT